MPTPHEITIDRDAGFARVRVRGVLDLPSHLAGMQALLRHPAFHRDLPVLHDLREADFSQLRVDEMERWYNANRSAAGDRGNASVAVVVPDGRAHALLEMYRRLGASGNLTIEVFSDLAPAEEWIQACGAQFRALHPPAA